MKDSPFYRFYRGKSFIEGGICCSKDEREHKEHDEEAQVSL